MDKVRDVRILPQNIFHFFTISVILEPFCGNLTGTQQLSKLFSFPVDLDDLNRNIYVGRKQ